MKKEKFGTLPDGKEVFLYTLENDKLRVGVLDYGCRIQSLFFDGVDFVCGYDSMEGYLADTSSQGAFVGRVANRIKDARFTLNGKTYTLPKNDGNNHLHGVFGQTVFQVHAYDGTAITFTHHSPATEEGYPGDMNLSVTYRLADDTLLLEYQATANEDTPINLTNHSYFNLGGIGSGSVREHEMQMHADRYTVTDSALIPTGERRDVTGTPYDFHDFHKIGERIEKTPGGYDTNFWLLQDTPVTIGGKALFAAVTVRSAAYQLDCYTDLPCIQIYSGNFLGVGESCPVFKYRVAQEKQHAICLETQFEPDAVNHGEGILRVGETYVHTTAYRLSHR